MRGGGLCGAASPQVCTRTAVNLQSPSSMRLGAQQQIRRPEPMHASRPMSPDIRPKGGMMKLKREQQDLPGHGSTEREQMRSKPTRGGRMGRARPEAHRRLCSSVGLHERCVAAAAHTTKQATAMHLALLASAGRSGLRTGCKIS